MQIESPLKLFPGSNPHGKIQRHSLSKNLAAASVKIYFLRKGGVYDNKDLQDVCFSEQGSCKGLDMNDENFDRLWSFFRTVRLLEWIESSSFQVGVCIICLSLM